jgi:hypothetical protein
MQSIINKKRLLINKTLGKGRRQALRIIIMPTGGRLLEEHSGKKRRFSR